MNMNVSEIKSVAFAVLNITKIMMNVAFLSIPYAMLKGGFGYMTLLIVLNAFFNCYTAIILALSSYGDDEKKSIPAEDIEQLPPPSETQQDTEDLYTITYPVVDKIDETQDTSYVEQDDTNDEIVAEMTQETHTAKANNANVVQTGNIVQHVSLTYTEISRKSYGPIGEILCALSILICDIGACAAYILVAAQSLNLVYRKLLPIHYMLLAVVVVLPFVYLKNVAKLSFMGFIGMLTFLGLVIATLVYGLKINRKHLIRFSQLEFIDLNTFYIAFGICKFSFCGHEVFITVRQGMSSQKQFKRAMVISCILIAISAFTVGCVGYFSFSNTTPEYIMQNFPVGTVFSDVIRVIVSLMLIASIPITIFAACEIVEYYNKRFLGHFSFYKYINTEERLIARILFRTPLMFMPIVCVLIMPNFTKIVSLVGGVFDTCLGLIFPVLIYTRLFWQECRWYWLLLHLIIFTFGIYGITCAILVFALE